MDLLWSCFFNEFINFLELLASTPCSLLITGDFNFHVDDFNNSSTKIFVRLLQTFNLVQHVGVSTHRCKHTLDLIITRADDNIVSGLSVTDPVISDHFPVICNRSMRKPPNSRMEITYRKNRSIDMQVFHQDIDKSSLMATCHSSCNLDELVDCYNSKICQIYWIGMHPC